MAEKTLFLAWHDTGENRLWYPVGRLDADPESSYYRFRYTGGAKRAQKEARFTLIVGFPAVDKDYRSEELFPLFQNRVMSPARPDFQSYLETLGYVGTAEPIEILAVNGGVRRTDNYEVFPKLEKQPDGGFTSRFLLHGGRHVNRDSQERLKRVKQGEELFIALELTNPVTQLAVQIQTRDNYILGWAPHYLVNDLVAAMADSPSEYKARAVRIHRDDHSPRPTLLVELSSRWDSYEPMSGPDYQPLVD